MARIPVNPSGASCESTPSEKALGKRKRTEMESLPSSSKSSFPAGRIDTTSHNAGSKDRSQSDLHPSLHDLDFTPEKGSHLAGWMKSREKALKKGFKNPPAKEIKFITKDEVFQVATFIDKQKGNKSEKPRQTLDIEIWETCTPNGRKAEMHEVADKVCQLLNRMPISSLLIWFRPTRGRGTQVKRHVFMETYRKIAVVYTAARNTFPEHICTIPYKIPMGTGALNEGNIAIDAHEDIFILCPAELSATVVIPAVPTIMAFEITDKKKKF
ncbi:hypothetical protein DM02DRAFT_621889 [Periconia macrospinosa]|uniref:Uncharacterized protein n=1 Tax=Periconia macrospinosa TaxID=97972 RepID=A0A2V1EEH0_9PLEO|nr:hypothetical protein DM02DRAFT_621889 [Periconia macrospinosa]